MSPFFFGQYNNYIMQHYTNETLIKICRKFLNGKKLRRVIDCGAHIGEFSYGFKDAEIVEAFEPNLEIITHFKKKCEKYKNIVLHQVALSNYIGTCAMSAHSHPGTNQIVDYNGNIETRTLDSYKFDNVDFIKLDVEGQEFCILEGSIKTIANSHPLILIEVNNSLERYGHKKIDAMSFMQKLGYSRIWKQWPNQIYSHNQNISLSYDS